MSSSSAPDCLDMLNHLIDLVKALNERVERHTWEWASWHNNNTIC